jgi:hypothetical protein
METKHSRNVSTEFGVDLHLVKPKTPGASVCTAPRPATKWRRPTPRLAGPKATIVGPVRLRDWLTVDKWGHPQHL